MRYVARATLRKSTAIAARTAQVRQERLKAQCKLCATTYQSTTHQQSQTGTIRHRLVTLIQSFLNTIIMIPLLKIV
jgi:hypothetical protein